MGDKLIVNYCAECGFKIEGEFKFCPNCGSKINSKIISSNEVRDTSAEFITCKNCGEKNPLENSDCFSCGIPLSGNKNKKQGGPKQELKKNDRKKSTVENISKKNKVINEEKVIDNKKILIISSAIVVVFIFALVASGVFDSGVQENVLQMSNQSLNSGVNLANLEEITQLEDKVSADPDDLESTLHLAHLQQDAGLSEKAIVNYKKYLIKFPENADARVDMAICYYNLSDYTTAISEMETAIKYQPKHQIAYLNLGIVNLAAQNLEVSKDWFKKTAELDPNTEAGKRAKELLNSH
ncbi:MAG: zinc ribbon domain-containing protein [Ignavibacteria bacterium]|nr:zinc ribbon domain-containing protein [Ignavibacteria bacterium]